MSQLLIGSGVSNDCLRNVALGAYKPSRHNLFWTSLYNHVVWYHGLSVNCNRYCAIAFSVQLAGIQVNRFGAFSILLHFSPFSQFPHSPLCSLYLCGFCEQNSVWNVVKSGSWLLVWGVCRSVLSACMIIIQSRTLCTESSVSISVSLQLASHKPKPQSR